MVIAPWPQGLVGIPAYAGILFICLVAAMVANGLIMDPPHCSPSPPQPQPGFFENDLGFRDIANMQNEDGCTPRKTQ